jgi:hypothetical protein
MTVLESIRVLGITSETLFARVADALRHGLPEEARAQLRVFDQAVEELERLTKEGHQ